MHVAFIDTQRIIHRHDFVMHGNACQTDYHLDYSFVTRVRTSLPKLGVLFCGFRMHALECLTLVTRPDCYRHVQTLGRASLR